MSEGLEVVEVKIEDLRPHPKNYREHPPEQLAHIRSSIEASGFYRNIIATKCGVILGGHGVVQAADAMGMETVPTYQLDIEPDSPQALKILAGDNETARSGLTDDVALAKILKELVDDSGLEGLLGTGIDKDGYDDFIGIMDGDISTVGDTDPHEEWKGMPEYDHTDPGFRKILVHFKDQESVEEFARRLECKMTDKTKFVWFPEDERLKVSDKRVVSES